MNEPRFSDSTTRDALASIRDFSPGFVPPARVPREAVDRMLTEKVHAINEQAKEPLAKAQLNMLNAERGIPNKPPPPPLAGDV